MLPAPERAKASVTMAVLSLKTPLPRLQRLCAALGLEVRLDPGAQRPVMGPHGPIELTSGFSFHQVRQVLREMGLAAASLRPTAGEGELWQAILHGMEGVALVDGVGEPDVAAPVLSELEAALDAHQALEVALVDHRLALMQADLPRARSTWDRFSSVMLHHIVVEDALVTPRYMGLEPAEGWQRGATPFIVDNEHNKIRTWVKEIDERLVAMHALPLEQPERAVHCLELLDRQKVFHDLLEHHDMRERAFIYPHLEAQLSKEDKAEIVTRLLTWS